MEELLAFLLTASEAPSPPRLHNEALALSAGSCRCVLSEDRAVIHESQNGAKSNGFFSVHLNLSSGCTDSLDARLLLSYVITYFFMLRN